MAKIVGQVIDTNSKAPNGQSAKVYISDAEGNVTAKNLTSVTDAEGKYTLEIPMVMKKSPMGTAIPFPDVDGKFITAKVLSGTNANKMVTIPFDQLGKPFNFDVKSAVATECDTCKKVKMWKGATYLLAVVAIGLTFAYIKKK